VVVKVRFAKGSFVGIVVAILMMATAGPAFAKEVHTFTGAFGVGELSLTEQSGVAINQETGDVYVGDTGNNRIVRYGPSGTPEGTLATATAPTFLALDNSAGGSGDIYVVEQGRSVITKMDPSGTPVATWGTAGHMEGFGEITGIAVDPSGNLFVMNSLASLRELSSGGAQTSQCAVPKVFGKTNPNGIAVDSNDDTYLNFEPGNHSINKVAAPPACESLGEGGGNKFPSSFGESNGVAVNEADDSTWRVHVGGNALYHFATDGTSLETTAEGLINAGQLAVRKDDETVYVADPGSDYVAIFSSVNVEPPHVTIEPPTVTGTTAHFHAEINPEAPVNDPSAWNVKYSFQCVPGCTGSGLSGTVPSGSAVVPREGTAEHLLPGTEYKVYITAENAAGRSLLRHRPHPALDQRRGDLGSLH
jgi:sugar lactone lactonase YvrE